MKVRANKNKIIATGLAVNEIGKQIIEVLRPASVTEDMVKPRKRGIYRLFRAGKQPYKSTGEH